MYPSLELSALRGPTSLAQASEQIEPGLCAAAELDDMRRLGSVALLADVAVEAEGALRDFPRAYCARHPAVAALPGAGSS